MKERVDFGGFGSAKKPLPTWDFLLNLVYKQAIMTAIVIDKKKYVLVPEKDYQALQKKAALKTKPEKVFTIEEARAHSKKLIRKWAAEK